VSRQDYLRVAEARVRSSPGTTLDPGSIRKPGSTLNVFYNGISAIGEENDRRSALRFASALVGASRGAALDAGILDRTYGRVVRKGAAASRVELGVFRSGTGAASTVPTGTEVAIGEELFTLDAPGVSFALGEGGPLVVKRGAFTAKRAGSATNVLVVSPRFTRTSLVPQTFLVALEDEPQATGGAERETDEAFLARYGLFTRGLEENIALLEAGALATPGIESAVAIEELSPEGLLTGWVVLHVADVNGRAGVALRALVVATLRGYRMTGQRVRILSALPALTTLVGSFGVLAGFSVGDVQARARAALVSSVNALEPGQSLLRARLAAALVAVPGVVILDSVPFGVTVPAADLIATVSTRFRTSEELVSFA
jgi:uncharacterized phage protein gp47/JayE